MFLYTLLTTVGFINLEIIKHNISVLWHI